MPLPSSRGAGSILWLISWVPITDFNLLERHKTTLKVNWKGVLFVTWDIPQYGGWQDWNLLQIKVSSFCQLERSNKQRMSLQSQHKGWFLRDACPVISVGIVSSSHSTYLKKIKPFKRIQAAFWSYCWCIFSFLSLSQAKEILSPLPAGADKTSSLQNLLVTNRESDTGFVPRQPLPYWSLLCRRHWKRRELHAGACSAELWRFISDHSLCITGGAPLAFGLLTNPIQ